MTFEPDSRHSAPNDQDQAGQEQDTNSQKEITPPEVHFDAAELLRADVPQSDIDDFLRYQSEESSDDSTGSFGELDETVVVKGRHGVLPPELGDEPLEPGELAFSIHAGEFQQIVRTLNVLLRNKAAHLRRCRITIQDDRIVWHANQGNAFIEYVTWGKVGDRPNADPIVLVVALNDLAAVAAATRTTATFRISHQDIRFSAELFRRPILTFSPQKFISHTDRLLADITFDDARPVVAARMLSNALSFAGPFAFNDDIVANNLNLVQIRDGSVIAGRHGAIAAVKTSALDGLLLAFRPHFLRPLLEALKLVSSVRIVHSEALCVLYNDQMTFGFELVALEFPPIPKVVCTDKILVPLASLKSALDRTNEMFGRDTLLVLKSDERGHSPFHVEARHQSSHPNRRFRRMTDAYREGPYEGPITLTIRGPYLRHTLQRFSDSNAQLEIGDRSMLYLESEAEDTKYSVLLHAEISK